MAVFLLRACCYQESSLPARGLFGGPEPGLKYLARYTHRAAMTLEAVEFIPIGGVPRQRL
jgi:hypothetical protein